MDSDELLAAIERESAAFTIALQSGAARDVPSCPGWRVADLAVHLGVIQRWTAEMVRSRASESLRGRDQLFGVDPEDPALVEWFEQGAHELVEVLRSSPVDAPVWSWTSDHSARFWIRRQAHEAAVHRWDAQNALGAGAARAIDAALAADGIDEWLRVYAFARIRRTSTRAGTGESFHFHCTDEHGEWIVRFEGAEIDVQSAHAKADVALRGASSDLLLFLWGRRSAETLEILGDASLLERWPELLPSI
jgi:uncharacterized protein (TIGR03083 family)